LAESANRTTSAWSSRHSSAKKGRWITAQDIEVSGGYNL
jgi:hypothetical protein